MSSPVRYSHSTSDEALASGERARRGAADWRRMCMPSCCAPHHHRPYVGALNRCRTECNRIRCCLCDDSNKVNKMIAGKFYVFLLGSWHCANVQYSTSGGVSIDDVSYFCQVVDRHYAWEIVNIYFCDWLQQMRRYRTTQDWPSQQSTVRHACILLRAVQMQLMWYQWLVHEWMKHD